MMFSANPAGPIGIYDSGVGGLSVLHAIRSLLPRERLIYVADTAYVPYGEKSRHAVIARAYAITEYFLARGAKAIAVPCNTATAAAINLLRERYPHLPIVGVEPAVKPAARLTRSGIIGVLATTGTLNSPRFRALTQREAPAAKVLMRPCPEWVLAAERGVVNGPEAIALVAPAVEEMLAQGADVLVLGCTHFPFLRGAIAACAGENVPVLETGSAVARQVERQLQARRLLATDTDGSSEFFASGDPQALALVASQLLGEPIRAHALPSAYC